MGVTGQPAPGVLHGAGMGGVSSIAAGGYFFPGVTERHDPVEHRSFFRRISFMNRFSNLLVERKSFFCGGTYGLDDAGENHGRFFHAVRGFEKLFLTIHQVPVEGSSADAQYGGGSSFVSAHPFKNARYILLLDFREGGHQFMARQQVIQGSSF